MMNMNTTINYNEMIEENMGLIYNVIHRSFPTYKEQYQEEMVQIGMISLFKAIKNFDESKGIKFSTLATTIIKNDLYTFVTNDIKRYQGVTDGYCVSTNEIFGNDDESTLENLLGTESDYYSNIQISSISQFIMTKDEKIQNIVKMLIEGYTNKEIGEYYGCSKQRINQIIQKLRKEIVQEFKNDSEFLAWQIINTKM